jgi:hypothetical protein
MSTRVQAARPIKTGCPCIALLVLVGGCVPTGWRRVDLTPRFSPRTQFQVWSRGSVARWRAVVVSRDSVSGIPYQMPLDCDSCRRSIALTDVDSLMEAKLGLAPGPRYVVDFIVFLLLLDAAMNSD